MHSCYYYFALTIHHASERLVVKFFFHEITRVVAGFLNNLLLVALLASFPLWKHGLIKNSGQKATKNVVISQCALCSQVSGQSASSQFPATYHAKSSHCWHTFPLYTWLLDGFWSRSEAANSLIDNNNNIDLWWQFSCCLSKFSFVWPLCETPFDHQHGRLISQLPDMMDFNWPTTTREHVVAAAANSVKYGESLSNCFSQHHRWIKLSNFFSRI